MIASCIIVPGLELWLPNPASAEDDGSSTWVPVTHVGDKDGFPGSCSQPGQVLAEVSIILDKSPKLSPQFS